jgi:AcrR family transcriptional regulator
MSNKNKKTSPKRPYTMRARARQQEDVHKRITLAAVYLHGTIGPARTTMEGIARRAGVRRATVYNHFPTELELMDACSSHWFSQNPPPDPGPWSEISDPAERAEFALAAMYSYYDGGKEMLENVMRDTPQVPALEKILEMKWWPLMDRMVDILAKGWGPSRNELRASIRVALDFFTWQTLATSGLSNKKAARLAVKWIATSGGQNKT